MASAWSVGMWFLAAPSRNTDRCKAISSAFFLDDGSSALEITSDDTVFLKHKALIKEDQVLIALVKIQNDRRSGGLRLGLLDAMDLPQARCRFGKYLKLFIQKPTDALTHFLKEQLHQPISIGTPSPSHKLGVRLHVKTVKGEAEIQLGGKAQVYPTDELLSNLKTKTCAVQSVIVYE